MGIRDDKLNCTGNSTGVGTRHRRRAGEKRPHQKGRGRTQSHGNVTKGMRGTRVQQRQQTASVTKVRREPRGCGRCSYASELLSVAEGSAQCCSDWESRIPHNRASSLSVTPAADSGWQERYSETESFQCHCGSERTPCSLCIALLLSLLHLSLIN